MSDSDNAKRSEPLLGKEAGPVIAAVITLLGSLLIYTFNQVRHIDERLDKLEQEASILLDGQGGVRPSKEALQAWFRLEALERHLLRHETKDHW